MKKNYMKSVNTRIDNELLVMIDAYCTEYQLSRTFVINRLLRFSLNKDMHFLDFLKD